MEELKKEMGKRLALHRKNVLHLTQEQTAEILDISLKHYSEIERGITGISVDGLVKISKLLGINVDYLLTGNNMTLGIPNEIISIYNSFSDEQKATTIEIIRLLASFK